MYYKNIENIDKITFKELSFSFENSIYPQMNLRTFDKYTELKFNADKTTNLVNYQDIGLNLPIDNTLLVLNNLLTLNECDELITEANGKYSDLRFEYLPGQRDSGRILNMNDAMAKILYDRIKNIIEKKCELTELKPFGFGIDGKWNPSGINPCFRHSAYTAPSNGFIPHRDSAYIDTEDRRSVLTIIIYLNDNFDGGETIFLKANKPRVPGETVREELSDGFEEIYCYKPVKGSAIIFNHNVIHAGCPILQGTKYIIRSDIIFERENNISDDSWRLNPKFLEAIELYREAGNQEMSGNVELAGELYERGLSLRQTNYL